MGAQGKFAGVGAWITGWVGRKVGEEHLYEPLIGQRGVVATGGDLLQSWE